MAEITVNAMGEQCPIPVVKATKALQGMTGPGVIEVLVDNEIAVQNLTRLGASQGCAVQAEKRGEGAYAVRILVKAVPAGNGAPADAPEDVPCAPDARGGLVAAIGSGCMGQGDDELGALLMKGFLFALSQLPELPRTVLFYNGGARLTVEGSASLEDLKTLEAQGVEILTCGTCLNFYGLTGKLAVGGVTNMYTIVEKLAGASRVIRP
ncbi:MAG: sulfurtransferase-like selenium metabolism protein YedF [Oscillospiraceae bacterium]|nr:sulfurtransferase-like selenium metabolism protein YedF [Oscillospiraceae bacterium]